MKNSFINGAMLLFTLFGIVYICVFSALSFILAKNNYSLANNYLESTKSYYNADYTACQKVKDIENGDFTVQIDDSRILNVVVKDNKIIKWTVNFVGEWEPDGFELIEEGLYASDIN